MGPTALDCSYVQRAMRLPKRDEVARGTTKVVVNDGACESTDCFHTRSWGPAHLQNLKDRLARGPQLLSFDGNEKVLRPGQGKGFPDSGNRLGALRATATLYKTASFTMSAERGIVGTPNRLSHNR